MPQRIVLAESPLEDALARALAVLREGGVLAFPTETVYGIGVRGDDPAAIARLLDVKGRDGAKPFARYVSGLEQAERAVPELPAAARRLMRALWPGPVTVVVPDGEGATGLRCPADLFTASLAARADFPLIGTSANRSGEPELADADAIVAELGDELDLVVDGGPRSGGRASTVVRIERDGSWSLLREGEIDRGLIAEELAPRWLFVCSGNTCRSPMAEAIARRLGQPLGLQTFSAGLFAAHGAPAAAEARRAMTELGLTLDAHRSRPVTEDLLERMDRILAMTAAHRDLLIERHPRHAPRVVLLGGEDDVPDPFGAPLAVYRRCAKRLDVLLRAILAAERPSADA